MTFAAAAFRSLRRDRSPQPDQGGHAMYHVLAILHRDVEGWSGDRPLPTFYLDPGVQGIVSPEHAQRIAADVVLAFHRGDPTITATITATLIHCPTA